MLVKFTPNSEIETEILNLQKRLGEPTISKTVQLVLSHYNDLLNKYQEKCKEFEEQEGLYNELVEDVGIFVDAQKKLKSHFEV